jgi:xanthine/CO dehydrogenase XdhC/CoxF family maturation factor
MRDILNIRRFWQNHAATELALCTLISKYGSAYRLPGAKKIIGRETGACGLLSGGCLEADIEQTVRENWDTLPFIRSFSTMNPEDKLFGYQAGCAGTIEILCERLPDIAAMDLFLPYGIEGRRRDVTVSIEGDTLGQRAFAGALPVFTGKTYVDRWQCPIQLFVVGCGLDAVPFFHLSEPLGWETHFLDYRDSLRQNLPVEAPVFILPLPEIPSKLAVGLNSAVLLMTHNYQADLEVLKVIAQNEQSRFGYIGCLGPRKRFEQMRDELGFAITEAIMEILHAPPGLFQGTHTPESIALSIVADIQSKIGIV